MFKVNYDEVNNVGGVIAEGEYEVVVNKAVENVTPSGAEYMDIQLIIRNDIDQKHKNQYIFASVFKSKATNEYHSGMVNSVCKALSIPNGTQFNSLNDMLNMFNKRVARVTVKHEEYKGDKQARVKYWNESKFQNCQHTFKDGFTEVSNSDVPF